MLGTIEEQIECRPWSETGRRCGSTPYDYTLSTYYHVYTRWYTTSYTQHTATAHFICHPSHTFTHIHAHTTTQPHTNTHTLTLITTTHTNTRHVHPTQPTHTCTRTHAHTHTHTHTHTHAPPHRPDTKVKPMLAVYIGIAGLAFNIIGVGLLNCGLGAGTQAPHVRKGAKSRHEPDPLVCRLPRDRVYGRVLCAECSCGNVLDPFATF